VFTAVGLGGNIYPLLLLRELQVDHVNPWQFAEEVNLNLRLELVLHAPIALCLLGAGAPASLCVVLVSAALRLCAHARGEYMLDTTKVRLFLSYAWEPRLRIIFPIRCSVRGCPAMRLFICDSLNSF
jgi:hypothetical protein